MLHTHYFRKWTRTPWWTRVFHLQKKGYLKNSELFGLARLHIDTNRESDKGYRSPLIIKNEENVKYSFLQKLMRKHPELNHININAEYNNENDYIDKKQKELYKMSLKYEKLINKGYKDSEAFDIILNKYKYNISEKITDNYITEGIFANNKMRSFMNVYQQQVEYESRQKVLRMQRDHKLVDFLKNNKDIPDYKSRYKITNKKEELDDIYNEDLNSETNKTDNYESFIKEIDQIDNDTQEFLSRNKYLINEYYSYIYTKDNLRNLGNIEILNSVNEKPKSIKKQFKNLLKNLDKLNITLDKDGEVDYSQCQNNNLVKKLKNNKWVKYILMQKDLDFGFDHLKQLKMKNLDLKEKLSELGDINLETNKDKIKKVDLSDIQNSINFELPDKQENINLNELNEDNKLNLNTLVYENAYRIDKNNILLESFEERILRLKQLWKENRIKNYNKEKDSDYINEQNEKLKELQDFTRRLKILIDKNAKEKTDKLFFEEHKNINFDFEKINFERLEQYLNLNTDYKINDHIDEKIYNDVLKMIKSDEINLDLVDPSQVNEDHLLNKNDDYQKILKFLKYQRMIFKLKEKNRNKYSNKDQNFQEEENEEELELLKKSEIKSEKDDFIGFLKESQNEEETEIKKKEEVPQKKKKMTKKEIRLMRKKLYR